MLFHCKPVNQQKTTIFALILWEEQRLNRFWSEKRCRNSTFTLSSKKSVLPSSFNTYLMVWKYNCEPLCRWYKKMHMEIFLMDFFSLLFSCLMLGKVHWILLWPPDICNIKVVSKVHNVYFFSSSCQSKQTPDVYFSCVTLKNLIIKCGT